MHIQLLIRAFRECWYQETGCREPKWVETGAGGSVTRCWGSKQGAGGPRRAARGPEAWLGVWKWVVVGRNIQWGLEKGGRGLGTRAEGLERGAGGLKEGASGSRHVPGLVAWYGHWWPELRCWWELVARYGVPVGPNTWLGGQSRVWVGVDGPGRSKTGGGGCKWVVVGSNTWMGVQNGCWGLKTSVGGS